MWGLVRGGEGWLLGCLSLAGCMIWFVGWDFYGRLMCVCFVCTCMKESHEPMVDPPYHSSVYRSTVIYSMQQATTDQIRQFLLSRISLIHPSTVIKTVFLVFIRWCSTKYISLSALICTADFVNVDDCIDQWLYPWLPADKNCMQVRECKLYAGSWVSCGILVQPTKKE